MAQYIDKSAIMAEIERRIADNKKDIERASHKNLEDYFEGYEDALVLFKEKFLDTIEMKEEPVGEDLEEAATKYARKQVTNPDYPTYNDEYELECAFEAGAQWQKKQMIDKACKWLKSYRQDTPDGIGYIAGIVDDKTIEEFKQAMKE